MTNFQGFFVRDDIGQLPNQTGSGWSGSPDVVFAGLNPIDPATLTTPAGYAKDFGATVIMNEPNNVYLRALNTLPTGATGRAWFFWVESDLALWPNKWRGDLVTVLGNNCNYQDIVASGPNVVCAAVQPYVWTPPPFVQAGAHYCAVNWMEYPPSINPTNPVQSFPYMGTCDNLAAFVLAHPNMGWRNTSDVSQAGPTWSQTVNVTGPAQAGIFNVGVQFVDMPTDTQYSFSITSPAAGIQPILEPVNGAMKYVTNPNGDDTVMVTNWPGGSQASMTINYLMGATNPPPTAQIVAKLTVPQSSLSDATNAHASRARALYLQDVHRLDGQGLRLPMIGPTVVMTLGAMHYTWSA